MQITDAWAGAVDGEALAAAAMVSAANRRAIEVRAEAAMLVEAVEDRAASVRTPFFSGSRGQNPTC